MPNIEDFNLRQLKDVRTDKIKIYVMDDGINTGAPNNYVISIPDHLNFEDKDTYIRFQQGSIDENMNGLTEFSLLEILIDRLTHFQTDTSDEGTYIPSEYNQRALNYLLQAKKELINRLEDRKIRNVSGKMIP